MKDKISKEDVIELRNAYNDYVSKLAEEIYWYGKGEKALANSIDHSKERKRLADILGKIFPTNSNEPGAVSGHEAEKEVFLLNNEDENFCPECGIGLNNSEKRLKFCQNCKAHWGE